jgi:hypothetical protein
VVIVFGGGAGKGFRRGRAGVATQCRCGREGRLPTRTAPRRPAL